MQGPGHMYMQEHCREGKLVHICIMTKELGIAE